MKFVFLILTSTFNIFFILHKICMCNLAMLNRLQFFLWYLNKNKNQKEQEIQYFDCLTLNLTWILWCLQNKSTYFYFHTPPTMEAILYPPSFIERLVSVDRRLLVKWLHSCNKTWQKRTEKKSQSIYGNLLIIARRSSIYIIINGLLDKHYKNTQDLKISTLFTNNLF